MSEKDMLKMTSSCCFAPGPVKKVLQWKLDNNDLHPDLSLLGRSHRSKEFLNLSLEVLDKTRSLLNIPKDYQIVALTGGATGAVEMALWNLLGPKPVDCLTWEVFGDVWYDDIKNQLQVPQVNLHKAPFGSYPSLDKVDFKHNDLLFVYSGSTSGVIFKDADKIPNDREGIVVSDATSYLFVYDIPWEKLDAVAFSWQKVIAGEAAHGMLVLSPRAIERLKSYTPSWPIPRLYKLKDNKGNLIDELFDKGICVNTPSVLAFIDANCNLDWTIKNGGIKFLQERRDTNYKIMQNWVNKTSWIDFLVQDESYRSKAIACLIMVDDKWQKLPLEQQRAANKFMLDYLCSNKIASDIPMHRAAPGLGFRVWLGPTIEGSDVELLTEWLEVAYKKMQEKFYN